jgi:hypothetical protein
MLARCIALVTYFVTMAVHEDARVVNQPMFAETIAE